MKARRFLTGFLLAIASAAAAVVFRRRAAHSRERAALYFADGTMLSLDDEQLLSPARELLATAR
jgi:hypothetical protein